MKKVLLLCAGHNELGLIRGLRKMGYYIVAAGSREHAAGQKWVDKWIRADYTDRELILDIAKNEHVDCICPCCNDHSVLTAAHVAHEMEMPGYDSCETILTLHDKDRFKRFAKKNGLITPESIGFSCETDAVNAIHDMPSPVIVKPVDCSAGKGVSVVRDAQETKIAVSCAFASSKSGRIVVEPFIQGTQHGFCTFLVNQKVVAWCSNDEFSILNPFRVEIDTFPASNTDECAPVLIAEIEKMADILCLKDGIFHLQYIYSDGKPWVIEVMRRTLGNMYHVPGDAVTGIDWGYWEARARCGLDCSDFPHPVRQEGFFAYKTVLSQEAGIINAIRIPNEFRKYVFDSLMLKGVGDKVAIYPEEPPVGFLFLMFSSAQEMKSLLVERYCSDFVKIADDVKG